VPSLTLEVTVAQWNRIKAAFTEGDVKPDAASMTVWIKRQLRARVAQYESRLANAAADAAVATELDAEGWSE